MKVTHHRAVASAGGLLGHPSRGCLSCQSLPPSQKLTKGRWDGETRPGTFSESLNSEDAFGGSPRDSTVPGATPPSQGPGSCTVHTGGHPPRVLATASTAHIPMHEKGR